VEGWKVYWKTGINYTAAHKFGDIVAILN